MDPESSPPNIPEYTGNHTKHKSFLVKKRSPEGEGEVENQSDPSDLANTTENVYKKEVIDDDLPVVARTSSNGDVHEEYKATDGEAWPIQETTIVVSAMETSSISNTSHPIATEDDPQAHEAVMLLTSSSNLVEQSDVTTDSTGSENASHPSLDENKWSDAEMTGNTRTEEVAASVESSPDAKDIGMEGVTAQPGKVSGDEFAAEIAGTEETSSETAIVHGDSSQQEATATLGVRVLVTSPAPVIDSHVAINAETSDAILPSEQVNSVCL
ncbi:hypothetical protein Pmar_PMAR003984 [Perkinsus marinus ATCC 50983]|uniref:Uncharacterized protein n=1 Tax=Perkinsus marinus (strain ATCC 50983 / TXsc) TaxID=423536 RepID=C5L948_PERM5|nr:hypothetical protein Pmar_PMAR003984 [Perkinsus marinus ATCC 50983]EER06761.1 hypothetical protein Pmar_PMAR003984 [Perkinsus marinus ATCC 50983]|eukprot:XP_002774945.1 hypothetical protein Pmar_PMAR003984 [Perkinsus marinus ATCC 50983]